MFITWCNSIVEGIAHLNTTLADVNGDNFERHTEATERQMLLLTMHHSSRNSENLIDFFFSLMRDEARTVYAYVDHSALTKHHPFQSNFEPDRGQCMFLNSSNIPWHRSNKTWVRADGLRYI